MARWAVVGGGVLGIALSQRLRAEGNDVTLIEASAELGGLASAWDIEVDGKAITWDRHYHVTLLSDSRTRAWLASLGLDSELRWVETKTGFYASDRSLRSVSNAVEFLRLPGLNLLDKSRLALTILYGSRIRNGRRMERIGVDKWLRRWSGRRTFDRFWQPLLRAKLGDAHTEASAAFIWSTIQRLYAARRTGLKKEMFGYVPGGYSRVFGRAAGVLAGAGVDIELDCAVQAIRRHNDHLAVEVADGRVLLFDNVVVTTGSHLAAKMCPDLKISERDRLLAIRYCGIVCASLVLARPLADYYLTYITDTETPFTAVIEMTAFVDSDEVAGKALVYLPKYTAPDDPLFDRSDEEIRETFMPYLRTMYPELRDDDVLALQVSRVRKVFAVPTLDYSTSMPTMTTSVPGLFLAGSAHLPFATLNVNDTLGLVEEFMNR